MRILAFTDFHGSRNSLRKLKEKAQRVDLLICAGDFTLFGQDLDFILREMNSWKKPLLLIPGNHEEHLDLKKECKPYPNIFEIDRAFYETKEALFAGYGGGGFAHVSPEFGIFARKINAMRARYKGKFMLLLHQPPFGTETDRMEFGHVGNETFTAFIAERQPDLVLCGHIHETFRRHDEIGKSKLLNPGPEGMFLEI